ncbi:MAG TPA: Hsp20/alpha crystallin family protein [Desulfomonilaceae bacterium]|nr:Hsp20/alpha crystallin family protein [Desulfomonilaceae bacterium]
MVRWRLGRDPLWGEFDRLQRDMNDLFGALSGTRRGFTDTLWSGARLFPLLNVIEADDHFVVSAEIPGMKTDDLEIKIEGDTLSLKGERKPYEIGEDESYHRRERATGTFQRSLTLPTRVDPEGVKATYKDGVLIITLHKEKSALPKQITITAE